MDPAEGRGVSLESVILDGVALEIIRGAPAPRLPFFPTGPGPVRRPKPLESLDPRPRASAQTPVSSQSPQIPAGAGGSDGAPKGGTNPHSPPITRPIRSRPRRRAPLRDEWSGPVPPDALGVRPSVSCHSRAGVPPGPVPARHPAAPRAWVPLHHPLGRGHLQEQEELLVRLLVGQVDAVPDESDPARRCGPGS